MAEDKESPFQVRDKRHFNVDGTVRDEDVLKKPIEEPILKEPILENQKNNKKESKQVFEDFEINFSTFVLSLASSVQISLGLIPHPATNKPEVNLMGAKQTIDILSMLDQKTKGNLDTDEDHLIKQILYELRMNYVEVLNRVNPKK